MIPSIGYNRAMHKPDGLLARGLAELGFTEPETGGGLHAALHEGLSRYVAELELWNPTHGLVNASGDELVVKHILDSLAPWKILRALLGEFGEGASLTDLGTGAGLPGIPLALAMPDLRVRLVERMGKRVSFLESMKAVLPLPNAEIVESEVERAPGPHALCTFRAFRPFSEIRLFRAVWARTAPGGAFAAYKGRRENAAEELRALCDQLAAPADLSLRRAAERAEIMDLKVPFLDDPRCLVVLRNR